MTTDELKQEVDKIKWFHRIDLGNGIITPGMDDTPAKLETLALPDSFHGLSVLDIGPWDGFFSFEAEKRGASSVLAADGWVWPHGMKKGFELARKTLNSKVKDIEIDVIDITPEKVGVFDVVLFLGVLYHLRHPLLALERLSKVTRKMLIMETHVQTNLGEWPAMRFYPGTELNNDPTNWWGPNPAAVKSMLESVGFKTVKSVYLAPQGDNGARHVVHAWR